MATNTLPSCSSFCPNADSDEEQEEGYSYEQATKGWEADDAVLLMRLYTAVAAAARAAIQHFATEVGFSGGCLGSVLGWVADTLVDRGGRARPGVRSCMMLKVVFQPSIWRHLPNSHCCLGTKGEWRRS